MKIDLELVINSKPDGRIFLNHWDNINGNDTCCQIIDNKLILHTYHENDTIEKELSLTEFIEIISNKYNET